jgi:voltage-gated potassium channel Kch
MAEFATMVKHDYGITVKAITTRNPQANAILERIHATLGNIIRTHQVLGTELDEGDPWSGILEAAMYATRATILTTLKATPMQLVFGRDAVLNTQFEVIGST